MTEKTAYEHGARKLEPLKGPDPHDAFSQKAAENKKPPLGIGLTEKTDERERERQIRPDGCQRQRASIAQGRRRQVPVFVEAVGNALTCHEEAPIPAPKFRSRPTPVHSRTFG